MMIPSQSEETMTKGVAPDFAYQLERFAECLSKIDTAHIRFHGDADGISAGIIMQFLISGPSFQNNTAFYQPSMAERDERSRHHVMLLDFGMNEESKEALKTIPSERLWIIDHHPITITGIPFRNVFSPWLFGYDSRYTTGYIVGEMVRAAGVKKSAVTFFQDVSLAGDRSPLRSVSPRAEQVALAFDFLASRRKHALPTYYELYRTGMWKTHYENAYAVLLNTLAGLETLQRTEMLGPYEVTFVPYESNTFPQKGRVAQELLKTRQGAAIVIAYDRSYVTFRANTNAIERGFSAPTLISTLKREYPHAILFGGGHKNAASMKVDPAMLDTIIEKVRFTLGGTR